MPSGAWVDDPYQSEVAASGIVQPMHGFDIARALAAAERRLFLLPESRYWTVCTGACLGTFGCVLAELCCCWAQSSRAVEAWIPKPRTHWWGRYIVIIIAMLQMCFNPDIARSQTCFCCRDVQLEHALLLHFASQHDEALHELQLYKQD